MHGKSSRRGQVVQAIMFQESLTNAGIKDFLADFPEEEEEEEFTKASLTPPKDFLAEFPEEEEFTEESSEFYLTEEDLKEYRELALKKFGYYAHIEEAYDYGNPEALDVLLQSLKCILYEDELKTLFKFSVNEQIEAFWETFYEQVDNLKMKWEENTHNDEMVQRFNKFLMKFSCWIDTFYTKIC